MWNRHESRQAAAPVAPSAPLEPSPAAVEGRPSRIGRPNASSNGGSLFIKGHVTSEEDLMVDGQVEGQIDLPGHALTVGPNARVKATIAAKVLTVFGAVSGTLVVHERLDIRNGAIIEGDVTCARIAIQDGAVVTGRITMPRRRSPYDAVTEMPALAPAV